MEKGDHTWSPLHFALGGTNVFGLPALGSLSYVKLHGLTFLQTAEAAGLNGREMHENVFARLAADKAVALGIVKPLYCSLFHMFVLVVPVLKLRWRESEKHCAGLLAFEARAARDRFCLTYCFKPTLFALLWQADYAGQGFSLTRCCGSHGPMAR
jgi:hypothetical protein